MYMFVLYFRTNQNPFEKQRRPRPQLVWIWGVTLYFHIWKIPLKQTITSLAVNKKQHLCFNIFAVNKINLFTACKILTNIEIVVKSPHLFNSLTIMKIITEHVLDGEEGNLFTPCSLYIKPTDFYSQKCITIYIFSTIKGSLRLLIR